MNNLLTEQGTYGKKSIGQKILTKNQKYIKTFS